VTLVGILYIKLVKVSEHKKPQAEGRHTYIDLQLLPSNRNIVRYTGGWS